MAKRKDKGKWDLEPQKSSAAQFLTYIASTGASDEKFEIRYEDENIWMSQKMLAAVYGVEVPNVAYHLRRLFSDAELDKAAVIKEILITAEDGKRPLWRMTQQKSAFLLSPIGEGITVVRSEDSCNVSFAEGSLGHRR